MSRARPNIGGQEILRDITLDGYRLITWDPERRDQLGAHFVGYAFIRPDGQILFEGKDIACSPLHAIDPDACLQSILTFLTLRPGDTDADFFEGYTEDQMEFATGDAEMLGLWAYDLGL